MNDLPSGPQNDLRTCRSVNFALEIGCKPEIEITNLNPQYSQHVCECRGTSCTVTLALTFTISLWKNKLTIWCFWEA